MEGAEGVGDGSEARACERECIMPLSKYDRYFGGKGGAAKAHSAMVSEYGEKKGEEVFYATKNKRKKRKGRTALSRG